MINWTALWRHSNVVLTCSLENSIATHIYVWPLAFSFAYRWERLQGFLWAPSARFLGVSTINKVSCSGHHPWGFLWGAPSVRFLVVSTISKVSCGGHHQQGFLWWAPSARFLVVGTIGKVSCCGQHRQGFLWWVPSARFLVVGTNSKVSGGEHHRQGFSWWAPLARFHVVGTIGKVSCGGSHLQSFLWWAPSARFLVVGTISKVSCGGHHQQGFLWWAPSARFLVVSTISKVSCGGRHLQGFLWWAPSAKFLVVGAICKVSCGEHHQQGFLWWTPLATAKASVKTTSGSALDGAVFDTTQILKSPRGQRVEWNNLSISLLWQASTRTRFLSLAWRKLRLCSANHRPGYWNNLPSDWPSTAWAYSERETENEPRSEECQLRLPTLMRCQISAWNMVVLCVLHWNRSRYEMALLMPTGFAPSQWETALFCNDVSHWLNASLESALSIFSGANSALVRIPQTNTLIESRQFSLPNMFTLCPFNSAIVWSFPSIFAHMHTCGMHYQWLWLNFCKGNSFGDHVWTINSPWLVKREVVITSSQGVTHWLKLSMTPSWRRLTTKNIWTVHKTV